jgi:hypothetical protein
MLTTGDSLVVQCVPEALLDMSVNVMRSMFSSVVTKRVYTLAFDRMSPDSPVFVGKLHRKLLAAREQRGVVCTTPAAIKSLFLKYLDLLRTVYQVSGDSFRHQKTRESEGSTGPMPLLGQEERAYGLSPTGIFKGFMNFIGRPDSPKGANRALPKPPVAGSPPVPGASASWGVAAEKRDQELSLAVTRGQVADGLASIMKLFSAEEKGVLIMDEVDLLLHPLKR